jgi:chromosome segregation protein
MDQAPGVVEPAAEVGADTATEPASTAQGLDKEEDAASPALDEAESTEAVAAEKAKPAEEAEEARSAGRDPEALDQEAVALRQQEAQLRSEVETAKAHLQATTSKLSSAEQSLKVEEDKIAAAMRAIADQREGTARQEGHIKSLAARLEAIAEEIARLVKARDEAHGSPQ